MLKRAALVCVVLAIAGLGLMPWAAEAQTPPPETSSLLVKLVAGLTVDEQAAVVARNGGTETGAIPALRLHVVEVLTVELADTMARYEADPQTQHVEENRVRRSEMLSNDALALDQWALPQIGWDLVFGAVAPTGTAKVAILDTGIDTSHPDLAGRVVAGTSILDGSNGMTDSNGHGTQVAGIVAANTDNAAGVAGVAFAGVQLVPVTVLDANGEGRDSDVIAGVIWAADNGADVILMAFSNPGFSPNLQDAIDYAWSRGAVLVAAIGNEGVSTPTFPAGDRGVIGVSGTDPADALLGYSNYGQAAFLAAPGDHVMTTDVGGGYAAVSGTSTSAAIVAGVAAFLKAVDPTLTNGMIVARMARTADPAGTQEQTGNGRVNMARALEDTGTDEIQPAGADPVGDGGPFVGPYLAAAININSFTVVSSSCDTAADTFSAGSDVCAKVTGLGGSGTTTGTIKWWAPGLDPDVDAATRSTNFSTTTGNASDIYPSIPALCGTWKTRVFQPAGTLKASDTFVVTGCGGTLVVKKHVINDNGGTNVAGDFTLHVKSGGVDVTGSPAAGTEGGTTYTLAAGTYVVSEESVSGYTQSFSGDCNSSGSVAVVAGQTKTCTLTNDDIQPKLTVTKVVHNNFGGTAQPDDFLLTVGGTAVSSGVQAGFNAGTYTVGETLVQGYGFDGFSGDCNGSGSVTLHVGDVKTCTLTNHDIQPKLIVIKHVINDDGAERVAGDFTMTVTGTNVQPSTPFAGAESPGTTVGLNAGSYSVDETGPDGYTDSSSADCTGSIAIGETKTCTITNDDFPARAKVTGGGQVPVNSSGGRASFGFEAQRTVDGGTVKGNFNYVDHVTGAHYNGPVTQIVVPGIVGGSNTVTLKGTCGTGCTFKVTVEDAEEPGAGQDRFEVVVQKGSTYTKPLQTISRGNIQRHY